MRSWLKWLAIGGAAVAALYVASHPYVLLVFTAKPLKPPTPPLLVDVHAGGDDYICPPRDADEAALARASHTPTEVEGRLAHEFPPGTDERHLASALSAQGFTFVRECDNDTSIRGARFVQDGGGFYGPYPIFADVAWKADPAGKIVWTKASVAYTGP